MIACLAAAMAIGLVPQTVDLTPTDDIWVYSNVPDQAKSQYLGVWGAEGMSTAPSPSETGEFSYAFLKFDVSALADKGDISAAILTVTMTSDRSFTVANAKESPLEARPMPSGFTEAKWAFDQVATIAPEQGAKAIFGSGFPAEIPTAKEFPVSIDLMKGPNNFAKYATEARSKDKVMAIALTSTMDPANVGRTGIYKFFSKDADKKEFRPVLHVTLKG